MESYLIFIACMIVLLLLFGLCFLYLRCRLMEQRKNDSIIRHIHEQDRLSKELERLRIEDDMLRRLLIDKMGSPPTEAGTGEAKNK